MNQDQTAGNKDAFNAKIKETWGRLSDSDIALLQSNKEQFFGKLQEVYGLKKEDAEKRLNELEKSCGCSANKAA